MATRMEKYGIEECLQSSCCGQPEKADARNKRLAEALKEFQEEHGRSPRDREFFEWLNQEE